MKEFLRVYTYEKESLLIISGGCYCILPWKILIRKWKVDPILSKLKGPSPIFFGKFGYLSSDSKLLKVIDLINLHYLEYHFPNRNKQLLVIS